MIILVMGELAAMRPAALSPLPGMVMSSSTTSGTSSLTRLTASLAGLYKRLGQEAEHKRVVELARKLPKEANEDEYQQACFEALCGNIDEALRLLKLALDTNLKTPDFANNDSDFDFLKDDKRFQDLVRSKPTIM